MPLIDMTENKMQPVDPNSNNSSENFNNRILQIPKDFDDIEKQFQLQKVNVVPNKLDDILPEFALAIFVFIIILIIFRNRKKLVYLCVNNIFFKVIVFAFFIILTVALLAFFSIGQIPISIVVSALIIAFAIKVR